MTQHAFPQSAPRWKTTRWFHGTRTGLLPEVLTKGLAPRSVTGRATNWGHTVASSPKAVYLTSAYGMYYAQHCHAPGLSAVLDIDPEKLEAARMVADEDSYALAQIQGMPELQRMGVNERASFWRGRLDETSADESLRILGNCAYLGVIPTLAIRGVRILTHQEVGILTAAVCDPVIVPANFQLLGSRYQKFCSWLLGYPTSRDEDFGRVLTPQYPVMTLREAVQVHATFDVAP